MIRIILQCLVHVTPRTNKQKRSNIHNSTIAKSTRAKLPDDNQPVKELFVNSFATTRRNFQ